MSTPTASAPAVQRLSFADDTFLKLDRALGLPMINQLAVIAQEPLDLERLKNAHRLLSSSGFNRLVVRPATPAARGYFVPSPATAPLAIESDPVDLDEEHYWFDRLLQTQLDPEVGPSWAIAAVPRVNGGHLVSFVFSHVQGDAGTLISILSAGARGELPPQEIASAPTGADHLKDAATQVRAIGSGLRQAVALVRSGQRVGRPQDDARTPPRPDVAPTSEPIELGASLIFSIDDKQMGEVAAAAGGTANSLLMALAVDTLVKVGRVSPGDVVPLSVPVNEQTRTNEANATVGVVIPADVDAIQAHDLRPLRASSKAKFVGLVEGSSPNPMVALRPLVQSLPDPLVRAASKNARGALVTVSNIGALPEELPDLFSEQVEGVVLRSIIQNLTEEKARQAQMGLTVHASSWGGRWTITMAVGDPDFFPNLTVTRQAVAQVLREWGLTPHWW